MQIKDISVIIPFRKNIYLENVLKQIIPFFNDIIVVGDEFEYQNNFGNVNFVKAPNLNASQSRNLGIKYAKNNYLFFFSQIIY